MLIDHAHSNARGIKDRCTVHPDMSRGHVSISEVTADIHVANVSSDADDPQISAFDRNWGVAVGYGDCQNPPGERPWN
jgi:hypothetical protein